jgi:hypothetical protein
MNRIMTLALGGEAGCIACRQTKKGAEAGFIQLRRPFMHLVASRGKPLLSYR